MSNQLLYKASVTSDILVSSPGASIRIVSRHIDVIMSEERTPLLDAVAKYLDVPVKFIPKTIVLQAEVKWIS